MRNTYTKVKTMRPGFFFYWFVSEYLNISRSIFRNWIKTIVFQKKSQANLKPIEAFF